MRPCLGSGGGMFPSKGDLHFTFSTACVIPSCYFVLTLRTTFLFLPLVWRVKLSMLFCSSFYQNKLYGNYSNCIIIQTRATRKLIYLTIWKGKLQPRDCGLLTMKGMVIACLVHCVANWKSRKDRDIQRWDWELSWFSISRIIQPLYVFFFYAVQLYFFMQA